MPSKKHKTKKQEEARVYAFLATFLTIIGFIIAIIVKPKDEYVMFYAKQGLVVFIFSLIAMAVGWIPLIGWAVWVLVVVVWIISWINALSGEKRNTFLVQEFAKKIKI